MRVKLHGFYLLGFFLLCALFALTTYAPSTVHAQTPASSATFPASFTDSSGLLHTLTAGSQYTQSGATPRQCAKYSGFGNEYGCINTDGTLDQCFVGPGGVPTCTTPKTADGGSTTSSQVGNTSLTASKDAAGNTTADAQTEADGCGVTHPGVCLRNAGMWLVKQLVLLFLGLAALFAGLAGYLLNSIIYITVFQFGNLIGNNPGMLAAWGVLRDLGNIVLLFGFIFMGISTILSLPGNEFTAKRALPALIIFAILMNFSLFAAEAVIDTSNALGTTFFKQASVSTCPSGEDYKTCATNQGIAGSIMRISGISAIFDPKIAEQIPKNDIAAIIEILGLTIFAAVAAFVFMAAVFMFVTRAVVLAFVMVVSPIGFAGMAIPPLHGLAMQWWDQLLKQSFFAPVYILMILISIKFMEGMTTALNVAGDGNTVTLASAFSASGISNVSMIVSFILIIGFMLGATQMAKSMGAVGAGAATKYSGALVFGGMARISNAGVNGIGLGIRKGLQASPIRNTGLARGITNFVRPLENVNTDFRKLGLGGVIAKQGGGAAAEHATLGDMRHQLQGVREKISADDTQYRKEVAERQLIQDLHDGQLTPESERHLAGLSADEIAANHNLQHSIDTLAEALSPDQFEGMMKSDKTSQTVKDQLASARFADGAQMAGEAYSPENRNAIRRMSNKEMELMAKYDGGNFTRLMAVAELGTGNTLTSNSQNESLENSNSLTRSQKQHVRDNTRRGRIEAAFTVAANPASAPADRAVAQANMRSYSIGLTPKEKNKMRDDAILDNNVAENLTSDDLREFMREAKFTNQADRARIGAIVRAVGNPDIDNYFRADARAAAYWS